MSGEEGLCADGFESEFNYGESRFFRETATPIGPAKMYAEFVDARFELIRAEAGAAGMAVRFEQENGPVLDVVAGGEFNFRVQSFLYLFS